MNIENKTIYLIGNWKSNKTFNEAELFFQELKIPHLSSNIHVAICPPFPYLFPLSNLIKEKAIPISLGAQTISPFPFGTYTGAVTPWMINTVAKYVIVGHSERRKHFCETNEIVAQQVRNVLDAQLRPILCIDEPYLESQLAFFTSAEFQQIIVAYEPVSFISDGTPGMTDNPDHANKIAHHVKEMTQSDVPVLYGGSVTESSVNQFISQDAISGVLVGGASLHSDSWSALVSAATIPNSAV